MRTIITLSFLILACSTQAQVPDYFANNPQWRQNWTFGYYWPCLHIHNYVYYLNGDSIVGNYSYKKVFKRGKVDYQWNAAPPSDMCDTSWLFNDFYTLIRQDNQEVYLCDLNGVDTLLYDFDLAVGDTLPITWNQWMDDIVVTTIDSILVGNSYRNIFNLTEVGPTSNILIEGIGFDGGLLEMFPFPEFPSFLLCFVLNDTTYYPSYGYPCDLTVDVPVFSNEKEFKWYPNPVINKLTIEFFNPSIIDRIIAFNTGGQEIYLRFEQTNPNKVVVDFLDMRKGLYTLQLNIRNSTSLKLKVIKD